MKKQLTAIIMVLTLLFTGAANVYAAEAPEGMEKATKEFLKEEYYDYKSDTLDLNSDTFQKFVVETPAEEGKESKEITIYAALADFQTVRDNIFTFDRKETVYFNATDGVMMTSTEIAALNDKSLSAYKDQFEHLGKKMNLGWILFLHSLLLIVPAYFVFVWGNQVYSITRFTIKNNLYNQHHTFN
ncbi:hypothetical protein [Alkalihalobacillus sp. AL-G]|uniref:hypothetical protein n=1 Tax=Alkalihalobacillus sp. AL-G TaxID=2926399 RepID=UPI00272BBAD1|nr:hypothetical protein [Alkalihalobacillus sp. AL-G]WLD92416.1 hypothetical protein MOJ78_15535 [Alkalihalobacillus sp. AL-G]